MLVSIWRLCIAISASGLGELNRCAKLLAHVTQVALNGGCAHTKNLFKELKRDYPPFGKKAVNDQTARAAFHDGGFLCGCTSGQKPVSS